MRLIDVLDYYAALEGRVLIEAALIVHGNSVGVFRLSSAVGARPAVGDIAAISLLLLSVVGVQHSPIADQLTIVDQPAARRQPRVGAVGETQDKIPPAYAL